MPVVALAPELVLVIGGVVAAILGISLAALFRPLLSAALGAIPYAGPWIAQHVEELLGAMIGAAWLGADAAIGPLADLFRRLLAVTDTLTRYTVGTIDNVFNRLYRLVNADLPALESRAYARAEQLAQVAIAHADQDAQVAIARADQEFESAIQHTDQLAELAISRADQDARQAIGYAQQLAQSAIAHTDQVGQALERLEQAGEATAVQYAGQLAGQVLEYVQGVQHGLGLEIERVAVQDQAYAQALERIAVDHADQVGAAVAAAAATATAGVAARVQELEDSPCIKACSPLGDIGGLVQDLEDAGLLAILLGVAAQAIHDPGGLARELQDDVVVPAQAGLAALRSLGLG